MYLDQTLAIALLLLFGYFGGQLARRLNIPGIPAYIIAGILIGPYLLKVVTPDLADALGVLKVLGISLIALMVGIEIKIDNLKLLWKKVMVISASQIIIVFVIVFLCFYYLVKLALPESLLLGAIATTTAPCIIVVLKELKANGNLTSTLIEIIAFTDTLAIILFGAVCALVFNFTNGETVSLTSIAAPLIFNVGLSFLIGGITGFILTYLLRNTRSTGHILALVLSFMLINSYLAYRFGFSPLLTNMISGFLLTNIHPSPGKIFNTLDEIEMPVFIVFFALAGATLSIEALVANWNLVLIYIAARTVGLIIGTVTGSHLSSAEPGIKRYLWSATLTKGALGMGLAMLVQQQFPEFAAVIIAVELSAVAILEAVGPMLAKYSLTAAGELPAN